MERRMETRGEGGRGEEDSEGEGGREEKEEGGVRGWRRKARRREGRGEVIGVGRGRWDEKIRGIHTRTSL